MKAPIVQALNPSQTKSAFRCSELLELRSAPASSAGKCMKDWSFAGLEFGRLLYPKPQKKPMQF